MKEAHRTSGPSASGLPSTPRQLSAEQIAYRLGRPYNTLMSELSPLRDTHKFDVNLLIPLDRMKSTRARQRLVNRGNGIVLRCATKGELAALLSLLRALFPHGGRMKDLMGRLRHEVRYRRQRPPRDSLSRLLVGDDHRLRSDGYCVELTSGLELVVREDELEDV